MLRSSAPLPPPPDVEPIDDAADRLAPVTFKPRGLGSIAIMLGQWEIGELRADNPAPGYQYRVLLTGLRPGWHRPATLDVARDRVVEIVRQWIEATPIARWIIDRERARIGARQNKGTG